MSNNINTKLNITFQTTTFNIDANRNLNDKFITSQFFNANELTPMEFNGYDKQPDEFIGSIDRTNRLRLPVELIGSVKGTKKPQPDLLGGLRNLKTFTRNNGKEFGFTVLPYGDQTTQKISGSGCVSLAMAFNQLQELEVGETLLQFEGDQKSKKVLIRPEVVNGGTVFMIENIKQTNLVSFFMGT